MFIFFAFLSEAQQYHVYTLQPLSNPSHVSSSAATAYNTTLTQQQQEYIHEQQELKGIYLSFLFIASCIMQINWGQQLKN